MTTRRIAAQRVVLADGSIHRQYVVELIDSRLANHYPLTGEIAHTEWINGLLEIDAEGHAWHVTTLDDGTQHKQLL